MKKKEIKLDLGCGNHKEKGFIGVDLRDLKGVDVLHDLTEFPWPWKDGTVSEIVVNYLFGYLTPSCRMKFMDECYRILKEEGKLSIKEPCWNTVRAYSDPFAQWPPVCEATFLVYNKEWRKKNEQYHYPIKCDFDFGYGHSLPSDIAVRNDEFKMMAVRHYNNAVIDLMVTLTKRG